MRLGLVYSFDESAWFSVNKIVKNLLASYQMAFEAEELVHINYSAKRKYVENDKSTAEAAKKQLKKIVFLDHNPHPVHWLRTLEKENGLEDIEEIVFHVFGDFTLKMREWRMLDSLTQGKRLKFICASHKQAKLIEKFCLQKSIIFVNPFPVDKREFSFDCAAGEKTRKRLGINVDDFIFFYAGRLSQQKNTEEMIELFLSLKESKELKANSKLLIAGDYDRIGMPYLQQGYELGEGFRKTDRILQRFPKPIRKDVVFLGEVKNKELSDYYNAADRFLSLSTYHDEDYGMAVAEALCSGLPALLTDWAGYSSFRVPDAPEGTRFIKTFLGERSPGFDKEQAAIEMVKASSNKLSAKQREEVAEKFGHAFSIEFAANNLKDILNKDVEDFAGFTAFLRQLGAIESVKWQPFISEFSKCFNELYFKVYDVYAE